MSNMFLRTICITAVLLWTGACAKIDVETRHVIEPIHITIDINVRIDKELDDFFGDIDKEEENLEESASE